MKKPLKLIKKSFAALKPSQRMACRYTYIEEEILKDGPLNPVVEGMKILYGPDYRPQI